MARISGVDLPREKRVEIGLTYIYGIGLSTSHKILAETGVNPDTRVRDLTEEEVTKIREYVKTLTIEGDLRREVALNIKRLVEIGCYREKVFQLEVKRLRLTQELEKVQRKLSQIRRSSEEGIRWLKKLKRLEEEKKERTLSMVLHTSNQLSITQ